MKNSIFKFLSLLSLILLVFASQQTNGQAPQAAPVEFEASEVIVPMRDGVKLNTVICAPKNAAQPLPLLMTRTPYGVSTGRCRNLSFGSKELVADGYIFVSQDIRGKYKS